MERFKPYVIDIAVLTLLFIAVIIVVIPWPVPEPALPKNSAPLFSKSIKGSIETIASRKAAVEVASVFGVRPAAQVKRSSPDAVSQAEPPVLITYMGYIAGENGVIKYCFKDSRSNEVLTLSLGADNGRGWKLVSVTNNAYTIVHKGVTYQVRK